MAEITNCPGAFGSDNQAGVHPEILDALARANAGSAPAYGADELTQKIEARFAAIFERDCAVFLVGTGTAANALALSAMCPPHGAILCHEEAHIVNDECTAPEFYTGGARQCAVGGVGGKPDLVELEQALKALTLRGIHSVKPSVLSLSNATELGTTYSPSQLAEYGSFARHNGLRLHVDGARFANALAFHGCTPADLSWRAGVDVLTLGATKNGALAAEAVVFFDPSLADGFAYKRKRAGQLWSKHRFLSAQFDAWFEDDLWLALAGHANAMARTLAAGLRQVDGVELPLPIEANEVFPVLPDGMAEKLWQQGFQFYPWPTVPGMVRLVTSYKTESEEVARFLSAVQSL